MTVLVALFVMLTSCSTDDGSGIIVAPGIEGEGVLENAVCYQGSWIVDDMVVDRSAPSWPAPFGMLIIRFL